MALPFPRPLRDRYATVTRPLQVMPADLADKSAIPYTNLEHQILSLQVSVTVA